MTRNGARLAALLAGLLLAITLGMSAANAQATVNVELNEWNIIPNVSSVAAGDVEFVATNTGAVEHELVVMKTDLAVDALPVTGGRVDEEGAGVANVGEIGSVAAGGTERVTLALEAGSYVLICNIAGHYQSGMHVGFTVSGTAVTAPAATATAPAPQVPRTGSGGAPAAGEGLPTVALIVALTALGGAILAAGGGWAVLRSRRPTR